MFSAETIREQNNDCNCSMTCNRTDFEPTLSYAQLSEFNIDQVALTTDVKKLAVKGKFEFATEKQQRVVEAILNSDTDKMESLIHTATELITTLNTVLNTSMNTTTLAQLYKFPDVLSEENSYPEEDVAFGKEHARQMKEMEKETDVEFKDAPFLLGMMIEDIISYDGGSSETLSTLDYCINTLGATGAETRMQICGPQQQQQGPQPPPQQQQQQQQQQQPQQNVCNRPWMEVCFPDEYGRVLGAVFHFQIYGEVDPDEIIHMATHDLTNLDEYNAVVDWTFGNETVDPVKFADHYTCQAGLETYQNVILPEYINFVKAIQSLENITLLTDTLALFTNLKNMLDTTLGPALLEQNPDGEWEMEEEMDGGPGGEGHGPDGENGGNSKLPECSWYQEIYDDEIKPFDMALASMEGAVASSHQTLRGKFNSWLEQIIKVTEKYEEDLESKIQAVKDYLAGDITKQALAEIMSDQQLTRNLAEFSTYNTDLKTYAKNLLSASKNFPRKIMKFYEQITEVQFPFINAATRSSYPFLQQLMTWYETGGGKQLIEAQLRLGEDGWDGITLNTTITENNVWMFLVDAIEGFHNDQWQRFTGLSMLIMQSNKINALVSALSTQLDQLIDDMADYSVRISMNTAFYM